MTPLSFSWQSHFSLKRPYLCCFNFVLFSLSLSLFIFEFLFYTIHWHLPREWQVETGCDQGTAWHCTATLMEPQGEDAFFEERGLSSFVVVVIIFVPNIRFEGRFCNNASRHCSRGCIVWIQRTSLTHFRAKTAVDATWLEYRDRSRNVAGETLAWSTNGFPL